MPVNAFLYASKFLVFTTSLIVFYLHEGATLQNVIIGANQAEGVREYFICDIHECSLMFLSDCTGCTYLGLANSAPWD